jgi:hypothetical protein
MKLQFKNPNLSESLKTITLITFLCFYFSSYLGYFMYRLFYNLFGKVNKTNFFTAITFKNTFNFENIKKFIINYIVKSFENWVECVNEKVTLLLKAIHEVIRGLKICNKKFKPILKFKHNLLLLNDLLIIFWEAIQIAISLFNELCFFIHIANYVMNLKKFIFLIISEYKFLIGIVYILLFFLVALLGIFFGMYKQDREIYLFTYLVI